MNFSKNRNFLLILSLIICMHQLYCQEYPTSWNCNTAGCINCQYSEYSQICLEFQCGIPGCTSCNNNQCQECGSEFAFKNNNCTQCPTSFCDECPFNNEGQNNICTKCVDQYYLNEEKKCLWCDDAISNCTNCSMISGQVLCYACDSTAAALNDNHECVGCPDGTTRCEWNGSQIISAQCDEYDGYYLNTETQICQLCPPNCNGCAYNSTGQLVCDSCTYAKNQGFVNNDGLCQSADSITPNCNSGNITNGQYMCQQCNDGYNLENGICTIIDCSGYTSNCITCSSSTSCETCQPSYYLNDSSQCAPCSVSNCNQCFSESVNTCSQCQQGFVLSADQTTCLQESLPVNCINGFIQYGETTITCGMCNGQQNDQQALEISTGFYPNANGTECLPCKEGCANCYVESDGQLDCMTCAYGYAYTVLKLGYGFCGEITVPNCLQAKQYYTDYACTQCEEGYYGYNGTCILQTQQNIYYSQ